MSGFDVEALLDSTEKSAPEPRAARDDRNNDKSDRQRERRRESSRDRDGKRRDRSRDRRRSGRDGDGDVDMTKSPRSDRGSAAGSYHSRRRSRSRDSSRHRHRDRNEYRKNGHTRSRSPRDDRYYRPSGDRRRNDKPDYDEHRDRDSRRKSRRSPSPRRKSPTPQPTEDERDRRTVFVQQLAARLRTKELIQFFEKVGPVKEAQIVKDRVSGRSKGVGYVEFKEEESVQLAIQLTGQKLLGIPIIAQLTEAEKNRQARTTDSASNAANGVPFHRLYVGNIHFSITEEDLHEVFEAFGELEFVQLQKEEMGRSRGYGFVQFRDPNEAKVALEHLNGFEIAGRPIRVGLGNDKFTPESTQNLLQKFNGLNQGPPSNFQGSAFSGQGGRGAHAGGSGGNFDRAGGRDNDKGAGGASALDDTDVAGVNFNNFSRDALMRKLARTDEPAVAEDKPKAKPTAQPRNIPSSVSQASRCILLKNCFNPQEEEGDWVQELEEEVRKECNAKYGKVVHIAVDPNTQGDIYIKFSQIDGGEKAIQGLNGRFFGGHTISAQPVVDAVYSSLFARTKAL